MRIGIDMLPVQSPGSRGRGIGRYAVNLVAALLARDDGHRYVLYAHDGFPIDQVPSSRRAALALLKPESALGETKLRDVMERVTRANPHSLDALLLISPFELCPGYDPPARPLGGPVLATVVHDLIPFIHQERYLCDPQNAAWFYRRLRTLKHYDVVLTNSEATRIDCLRMLDLPEHRVVTIGGAGNGAFFHPDRSFPMPLQTRATLHRLGVRRAFVFGLAGLDERKNLLGLIDAFRMLPAALRNRHQLVVTCALPEEDGYRIRRYAEERGVADALVLTGEISDEALRVLYQRCSAFVFPSHFEGLGLPLLEAMHCGAAVIGGNNSAQIEVVGDAGLLVNAHDAGDISAKLARVLEDPELARSLGDRALAWSSQFTWERSAERAIHALERVVGRVATSRRPAPRPRLAVISPWPPKGSGIADYAARLVGELSRMYRVDLYHDAGYVPDLGLRSAEFPCYDYRLLDRNTSLLGYRGVLYQMGNSPYHGFMYDLMARHHGIVTLHDFNLAAFHYWRAHRGSSPEAEFRRDLEACNPDRAGELSEQIDDWKHEHGGVPGACVRRGLHFNRRVFAWADAVVVHSPWCWTESCEVDPSHGEKTFVIPMGASPRRVSREGREAIRARFGLPAEALILGSFGILAQSKMNVEAIRAFAAIADEVPSALLVFAGQDWENGEARAEVGRLGLEHRVRLLGRQSDEDFADLIAATDVGICLRRPPTYGETSAALLDLLRHGIPTLVTDVATFADYPDSVVEKVRWPEAGQEGLARLVRALVLDEPRRLALGRSAQSYVSDQHAWGRSAQMYVEIIERCHARRRELRVA